MKLTNLFSHIKSDSNAQIKQSKENPSTAPASPKQAEAKVTDRVELSTGSLDVQKIKEVLTETPDIRTEKVQALKEQIEQGTYSVDSRKVADKMLISLLSDNI